MTASNGVEWRQIGGAESELPVVDERVVACFLSKVFFFWQGRNAYHGATSSHYPKASAFWPSRTHLEFEVQRWRTRGTYFTFTELPTLVLEGNRHCVALFQPDDQSPFRGFGEGALAGTTMAELVTLVRSRVENVYCYVSRRGSLNPAELPFQTWDSRTRSGGGFLWWVRNHSESYRFDIGSVLSLASRICVHLNENR